MSQSRRSDLDANWHVSAVCWVDQSHLGTIDVVLQFLKLVDIIYVPVTRHKDSQIGPCHWRTSCNIVMTFQHGLQCTNLYET